MIKLRGIQVDIDPDYLGTNYVVFTVEFENDCKVLVCHTCETPLRVALSTLLDKIIRGDSSYLPATMVALAKSKYITVQVTRPAESTPFDVFKLKYELIESYNAFAPGGHNIPYTYGQATIEKQMAKRAILRQVAGLFDKSEYHKPKGRTPKPVYQYGRVLSVWRVIKSYPSLSAVAKEMPDICISNISMCCKDPQRTAYGYKWSYSPDAVLELNS